MTEMSFVARTISYVGKLVLIEFLCHQTYIFSGKWVLKHLIRLRENKKDRKPVCGSHGNAAIAMRKTGLLKLP